VTRARLAHLFPIALLRTALPAADAWHPHPVAAERAAWDAVPASRRHPVLARAATILGTSWPALPATLFAEFRRTGDRERFEGPWFERRDRLAALVLAECLSGRGEHLDEIVNGVWAICEETTWCLPAHNIVPGLPASPLPDAAFPVVDLFAAETGALLAWTSYLLAGALTPELGMVVERIRHEGGRRLLDPYRCVDDWHWLRRRAGERGPNNWNPWIHSNLLTVTLLLERDAERRASLVARILRGLDEFLDGYGEDGGCDEGAGYWWRAAASLFECLETLHDASGGTLDGFQLPIVRVMGTYLHRMHIGGHWYVNFADGSARMRRPGEVLYRYGRRVGDRAMTAHALAMQSTPADGSPHDRAEDSIARWLPRLLDDEYAGAPGEAFPCVRDAWLPSIEVLTCRQAGGTERGLFLAAKGGNNGESHNHNDVGSFILALDGEPMLIDAGVGVYTRTTFSENRYTIWTMQSAFHNLPLVDGVQQAAGGEARARDVLCEIGDDATWLSMDLAGVYPASLDLRRWARLLRLERTGDGRVVVREQWELAREPCGLALHLMSWRRPATPEPGRLLFPSGVRSLALDYDAEALEASVEEIELNDARLSSVWGRRIHRVILSARHPTATGSTTLMMTPVA
jgi:hypothetical protein